MSRKRRARPALQRDPAHPWDVLVNGTPLDGIRCTFADVTAREPVALVGGCGFLKIAVDQGSAQERFGDPNSVHVEVRSHADADGPGVFAQARPSRVAAARSSCGSPRSSGRYPGLGGAS